MLGLATTKCSMEECLCDCVCVWVSECVASDSLFVNEMNGS